MKHFFLTLLSFTFLFYFQGYGQCPDPNITDDGFHPPADSLPCIVNNSAIYDETVQVNVPASFDTTLQFVGQVTITIDSIRIDSINNRPSGINYSCVPGDCVFEGGEAGCVNFSGNTSDPAMEYDLEIYATAWVTVPQSVPIFGGEQTISGFDLSQAGLNYHLTVIDPSDPCPNTTTPTPDEFTASVSASANDLCSGESSVLEVTPTNGAMPYASYSWSPDSSLNDATITTPTATPTSTTTYNVTVTDDTGGVATASVTINVTEAPSASFTTTDNGNGDFSFDASASTGSGLSYAWDFGNDSTATGANASFTYTTEDSYDVVLTVTDECDSTATFTETVDVILTSIQSLSSADVSVKVYPNPNNGNFEVRIQTAELSNNFNLRLIDLQGKVLYQEAFSNNTLNINKSLNMQDINSGVYFLHVGSGEVSHVERLVIQK